MASVTVAAAAKKVAAALASNKKGRKIIGYVIGIAFFIACVPVLVLITLFGPLANAGNDPLSFAGIVDGIYSSEHGEDLRRVEKFFNEEGLDDAAIHKAQWVCLCYLFPEAEIDDDFCERLAACFTDANEDDSVYDLLEYEFGIEISARDRSILDDLYGSTP